MLYSKQFFYSVVYILRESVFKLLFKIVLVFSTFEDKKIVLTPNQDVLVFSLLKT